jgi:DNA gyrase subunit A
MTRDNLDFENLPPQVQAFIDALVAENARLRAELADLRSHSGRAAPATPRPSPSPSEESFAPLPTPRHPPEVMVVSITARTSAKRTPLNAYSAQHRGGTGIYDIKASDEDPVRHLIVAAASATLLVLTSRCRAFRLPLADIALTEVRGRGEPLTERLALTPEESITAVLPLDEADTRPQVLIGTQRGWIRKVRRNYVGPALRPGTLLYDPHEGGEPMALALSDGLADIFMATAQGQGIRFAEKLVPLRGALGIRVKPEDTVVGVCPVTDQQPVLFITRDGKGTRRPMDEFAGQSAGGQGKVAMKTEELVLAASVRDEDEVLCISELGKIIRFPAADIPARPSAVQGVAVMELQRDRVASVVIIPPPTVEMPT